MKEVRYTCDMCKKLIDGKTYPFSDRNHQIVGGGELCVLQYEGIMGHNKVPQDGWHYHYECFCMVVDAILKTNN